MWELRSVFQCNFVAQPSRFIRAGAIGDINRELKSFSLLEIYEGSKRSEARGELRNIRHEAIVA